MRLAALYTDQVPKSDLSRELAKTKEVVVEYPIGHKRRRKDGIPLLVDKFKVNLARVFPAKQIAAILDVSLDQKKLDSMPVHEYVDLLVRP